MKIKSHFLVILIFVVTWGCKNPLDSSETLVTGVENPNILLNGIWKFSMSPPDKFWENNIDFNSWEDILVPGECQMQGFPIKHDTPYAYKTEFTIPDDYDGKQINLDFYGVYSYARVWINGNYVRDHFGGFTKWSCDISKFVDAGEKAILTIEISDRTDDISYGSGYAKHQIGGILRDVELTALPKLNFRQLYFETDLDENYKNADLKVFYELNQPSNAEIKIELFDADKNRIETIEQSASQQKGELKLSLKDPLKWDAEHPNLYTVVTTLSENGKEILRTAEKIGFREVEIVENKMLVNGKVVKLRGACRHDIHPTLGRMTTPEYDLKDVLLAKECNMNFIRTSHYPPSEKFLEHCDAYGLYVEDETAVCFVGSHRTEAYRATGASENDPEFTERYMSQLQEMVENHRNHPSIVMWSIGNENKFGDNFKLSYDWVKENDSTRPVIFSYPQNVPEGIEAYEIFSNHYPNWDGTSIRYRGATIKGFEYGNIPALFDEWAHVACYNNFELKEDPNVRNFWAQSLDSMWTYLFESEGGLGGAIWCMLDETFMLPEDLEGFNEWWGILDKNIIPATYEGPTVGYGEWGIVDTWRRKKPEFWGTKKAYSPTKIYSKQLNDFEKGKVLEVPVHNRFDHTNFLELKIAWRYGEQSGELLAFDLEPHEKGKLLIPAQNWNSETKLNIRFFKKDTFLVDEYNLQIGERPVELPQCKPGKLEVQEDKNLIKVLSEKYSVNINRNTGRLENFRLDGELLIQSGPHLNLKIPGARVQYSTIKMDDHAKSWKCLNVNFEEKNGIATVAVTGNYENNTLFDYIITFDENGLFDISYDVTNINLDIKIQEAGLKFVVGDNFEKMAWDINSYFTAYPENHMGSPVGEVSLTVKPIMKYRQEPLHNWDLDTKGFYYFGLEPELPYTNIVRGMKENIYSYSLKTGKAKIDLLSNGSQAARYDKID